MRKAQPAPDPRPAVIRMYEQQLTFVMCEALKNAIEERGDLPLLDTHTASVQAHISHAVQAGLICGLRMHKALRPDDYLAALEWADKSESFAK